MYVFYRKKLDSTEEEEAKAPIILPLTVCVLQWPTTAQKMFMLLLLLHNFLVISIG